MTLKELINGSNSRPFQGKIIGDLYIHDDFYEHILAMVVPEDKNTLGKGLLRFLKETVEADPNVNRDEILNGTVVEVTVIPKMRPHDPCSTCAILISRATQ